MELGGGPGMRAAGAEIDQGREGLDEVHTEVPASVIAARPEQRCRALVLGQHEAGVDEGEMARVGVRAQVGQKRTLHALGCLLGLLLPLGRGGPSGRIGRFLLLLGRGLGLGPQLIIARQHRITPQRADRVAQVP